MELVVNNEQAIEMSRTAPNKPLLEKVDPKDGKELESVKCLNLEHIEKEHIQKVLEINGGNRSLTAKDLGIGRNTLYRKLEKYR
ncbi:MAG TPA: sigma-54-dependent Fis family transcriptional regulator, partial [Eubacteriaceae bacterium]|nr:sigma-54-dependent Fis family transcriptional regulator [Eubacteriaceae bacterium]